MPSDRAMEKAREIMDAQWGATGLGWNRKTSQQFEIMAAALDAFAEQAVAEEREMHIETLREMIVLLQDRHNTVSGIADRCHSRLAQLYVLIEQRGREANK